MSQLPQLIAYEEIYDLDTFQLEDMQKHISQQVTDDQQWNKKAKKILDLIQLELKERLAIENFAFNIKIDDFIQQPIYQNNALQAILNDIKNRPANYLDVNFAKPPLPKQEQQQQQPILKSDALSTSTMTRSSHGRPQPKKVNQMQEFMKDVLKKTDVTNQQFVIGAAVNHRYVPPPPKPQLTTVEKIKQEKMLKKKKKKKGRTESTSKAVDHLPSINKPTMQSSGVHSTSSKISQLKQGSLEVNQENKEQKSDTIFTSQQKTEIKNDSHLTINNKTEHIPFHNELNKIETNDIAIQLKKSQSNFIGDTLKPKEQIFKQQSIDFSIPDKQEGDYQLPIHSTKNCLEQPGEEQETKEEILEGSEKQQSTQQSSHIIKETTLQNAYHQSQQIKFENQQNAKTQLFQEEKIHKNRNQVTNLEMNELNQQDDSEIKKYSMQKRKSNEEITQNEKTTYDQSINNHYNYVSQEQQSQNPLKENQEYLASIQKLQNQQEDDVYDDNFQDEGEDEDQEEIQKPKQQTQQGKREVNQNTSQQVRSLSNAVKQNNVNGKTHSYKQVTAQRQVSMKQPNSKQSQRSQQKNPDQKKQDEEEEIVEDFHEIESDHEPVAPVKQKPLKELVGKVVGRSDQPKYKGVIEVKQKPVQTDKEKMEEINNICKEMGLEEFKQKQQPPPPLNKAITPSQNNRPKNNPQSKYIQKMLQHIDDSNLEDYSDILPSFSHLFSGFFNNQSHYNHLDVMREIYGIFQQHIEKVDNVDSLLGKYKQNPLAINPNELVYINDPQRLIQYSTKTGIDIQSYIQRQMTFNRRLQNESGGCGKQERYFRVVKTKEEVYDIITRSFMRKQGWTELPHGIGLRTSWNVLWTWSKPQIDLNKLLYFQKVNHFPFNKNLGRKDLLKKNIERCQKLGAKANQMFDIIPSTFLLPKEYVQFMEKFYKDSEMEGQQNIWIMKPTGKSRGRGITVLNDISDVMYAEPVVLQKYLKNPLLLKGHKFDMRIYVLVTSFNPLEVFLYKEGFARLTTQPFTLDINDLKNQLVHLTNFAVQKTHVQIHDLEQQLGGCKISLRQLREKLVDKNVDWNKIWEQVQDIVLKSLVACQSEIPNNPNSFELFGYDIIIDQNHKCWLLEVNVSPSLARDYVLDELIKQQLIDDIFDLLETPTYDRQRLCEVLERRIQEEQGCKSVINTMNNSKLQLQRDINYILNGQHIRRVGEMPKNMGGFMRLAPSEKYDKFKNLVQSYKTINGRGTID